MSENFVEEWLKKYLAFSQEQYYCFPKYFQYEKQLVELSLLERFMLTLEYQEMLRYREKYGSVEL